MRRPAAAAVLAVTLALPAVASAHVTVTPPYIEDGIETTLAFVVPNERPPHATVSVHVLVPPGLSITSATTPAGWKMTRSGSTVTWSGGRIEGRKTVSFPIRAVAKVRAGTYSFTSTQTYDDGGKVRWAASLSVLPATGAEAPKQDPWGALVAAVAGTVVIAGSIVAARHFRRRPLQDP